MRVCIIGAGGVFGNNFAQLCLEYGATVMGIGRNTKKPPCFSLGVEYPYHAYHITYELEYVMREIKKFKPDYIVNFAAQGEGAASWDKDNWRFYETNCVGLSRLVGELNEWKEFEKFVHIGTSELYGSRETPAKEDAPITPTSPYGVSKVAFDLHLDVMWKRLKFPMNIVRPCNAYAPGQQLHRVIPKTIITGLQGKKIELHGGGKSRKSYLHATDVSRGTFIVMKNAPCGEIYNVASDDPTSIRDVVTLCAKALKIPFDELVTEAPERFGQDGTYWMDSTKIKSLGWKQTISWERGLEDMVRWVKDYPELLTMPTNFIMRA